jgi:hypothetical protein
MPHARPTPDCDWMVILPYTPRADSDARGYEVWLREVDNVFFNRVPPIAHYANWAVGRAIAGAPGFTHFDFMRFVSEADIERAWSNVDLRAFATGWVTQWGKDPAADPSVNYHAHVARRLSGSPGDDAAPLFLALDLPAPAEAGEQWEVVRPIVGTPAFHRFAIHRGAAPAAGYAPVIVEGRLIAAP